MKRALSSRHAVFPGGLIMAKTAKKKTAAQLRGKGRDYEARTDRQKIRTQWHKLTGLHSRLEWSAAVVRAASACEIAANFAIRAEFDDRTNFSKSYVDSLLIWANGLDGKMKRLLLPMLTKEEKPDFAGLPQLAETVSRARNRITHQGDFMEEEASKEIIEAARKFIEKLVKIYDSSFRLEDRRGYGK
jgi:hypothetical protein